MDYPEILETQDTPDTRRR